MYMNKDLVNDLCSEFFQLSENSLFELDGISNVYYESIGMYARNINNQLNNLIILLNRCDNKS